MRRATALTAAIVALAGATTAQARTMRLHPRLRPVDPCWLLEHKPVAPDAQTITVIDQAGVNPEQLCRVEAAVEDQALQLRAAWGTPPITFGAGGWPVYVKPNTPQSGEASGESIGLHTTSCGNSACTTFIPYAVVIHSYVCVNLPSCSRRQPWTVPFSHEVLEMVANPLDQSAIREVCDPVWRDSYMLDGVRVAAFMTPAKTTAS